jgi:hypothetical protein
MTEGAPPWSAQFSLAELEAVVAEAHRLGKRSPRTRTAGWVSLRP